MSRQTVDATWRELAFGTTVTEPGSSKYNRTGDWRSSQPVWNLDQCVKCGVCAVFCPEGCIEMQREGFPKSDMEYCKGCAICAQECWTGCIAMQEEKE